MDRNLKDQHGALLQLPFVVLLNPNTSIAATRTMMAAVGPDAIPGYRIEGRTVPSGVALITNPAQLKAAIPVTVQTGASVAAEGAAGIVVAGFGDPGLFELRECVSIPVVGIAEAGMLEAAREERRFSVVTTTPSLSASIRTMAERYGIGHFLASVRITPGDPASLMTDPRRLEEALAQLADEAIRLDDVGAIVVGGGPLAAAARAISCRFHIPVIEPVPAALRLLTRQLPGEGRSQTS